MKKAIIILVLYTSLSNVYAQQTIYVNAMAAGGGSGLSWATAYNNLQTALSASTYGDEIWVAQGTYYPTNTTNRDISFGLKNGVRILGGFAGNETSSAARDWDMYPTILSGNIGLSNSRVDNSQQVVTGINLDSTTVLDGFVITDGYTDEQYGAGLGLGANGGYVSRPSIVHCFFTRNYAYSGGAVYTGSPSESDYVHPVFSECTFTFNRAIEAGGAFYKQGPTVPGDTFLLYNCRFSDNRIPAGKGGAVYFEDIKNSNIRLKGCLFERDSSWEGGAVTSHPSLPGNYQASFIFDSCTFYKNFALEGGGFHFRGVFDGPGHQLNFTFRDCVFRENISSTSAGAAYMIDVAPEVNIKFVILRSVFFNNNPLRTPSTSLIRCSQDCRISLRIDQCQYVRNSSFPVFCVMNDPEQFNQADIIVTNSMFERNRDGAIQSRSIGENNFMNTTIRNCTFFKNGNPTLFKTTYPGYINYPDSFNNKMLVSNSIVWEPNFHPSQLFTNYNPTEPMFYPSGWGYIFSHSLLPQFPLDTGILTGGHFYDGVVFRKYPEFIDTANGNFRLKPCSPLVNKGSNAALLPDGLVTDLDGLPRIANDTVDFGAYEQQQACFSATSNPVLSYPVIISPNPSTGDQIFLETGVPDEKNAVVHLRNVQGNLIRTAIIQGSDRIAIITSHLPPGFYFVEVDVSGKRYLGKWIKM